MSVNNPIYFPSAPSASDITASSVLHFNVFCFVFVLFCFLHLSRLAFSFIFYFCSSLLQDVCQDALQGSCSAAGGRCGVGLIHLNSSRRGEIDSFHFMDSDFIAEHFCISDIYFDLRLMRSEVTAFIILPAP